MKTYIAGHRGMVGGAITCQLQQRDEAELISRLSEVEIAA